MPCCAKPGCLILAGGRGSRLQHADKGLLEVQGRTLIAHIVDQLRGDIDDLVISANRNHDHYHQYTSRVIADEARWQQLGPLAGIASALPHCRHDTVLVTSCDIPFLPDDLCPRLLAAMGDCDVCISETGQGWQPVFLLHRRCLPDLAATLDQRQLSLMHWLQRQSHCVVHFDVQAPVFVNINTPEQLLSCTQAAATKS